MSVCNFDDSGGYTVVSSGGRENQTALSDCNCPDATHRDVICKHSRHLAFELGEAVVPSTIDEGEIDDQLGEHLEDADVRFAVDLEAKQATPRMQSDTAGRAVATDGDAFNGTNYTYHTEPPEVGGARFVRCKECGREWILADRDRILHHEGCEVAEDDPTPS